MYGAEAWSLTNKLRQNDNDMGRKDFGKIYGPTYENGHWRININSELESKFKT
jgi:hypothetical protein